MPPDALERLLHELRRLPSEAPWVEFKEKNASPEMIGETISALSNAAALTPGRWTRATGYLHACLKHIFREEMTN